MGDLRAPDSTAGPFAEKTTRVLTATVKDENGTVIPGTSLTTMVYTLFNEDSPTYAVINGRDQVDAKPNVNANGVLTLELNPTDMLIQDQTKVEERHRVLLQWTYAAGAKRGSHEIQFSIQNVEKVT